MQSGPPAATSGPLGERQAEAVRQQAAASMEATARLQALTERILGDIADDAWSPAAADLADLHERLDGEWRAWRKTLGPQP